jgi:hypothetical protein
MYEIAHSGKNVKKVSREEAVKLWDVGKAVSRPGWRLSLVLLFFLFAAMP